MNRLRTDGVALALGIQERLNATGVVPFDLLVCPPATLIWPVADAIRGGGLAIGGQDCHSRTNGAHTGDISAAMLAEAGCTLSLIHI